MLLPETKDQSEILTLLRAALIEGEESGPAEPFDFEVFINSQKAASSE